MDMEQSNKSDERNEQVSRSANTNPIREVSAAPEKSIKTQDLWTTKSTEDLAPVSSLLSMGLKYAIKDYCEMIPKAHFQSFGIQPSLDGKLVVLLYRCTRELIDNAVKHAHAQNIFVQLLTDEDYLSVTVQDDGIGFDPEHVAISSGLANIANAVETFNGIMNIDSTPGLETTISIEIEEPQKVRDL